MTSSGTTTFDPSIADLVIEAYGRCEIRPGALTVEHMQSARMSCNLELVTWSNRQVNLWKVDLHDAIPLLDGIVTYDLDTDVVSVLDVYLTETRNGVSVDRIMTPMSRTEYANISDKLQEGSPSQYWAERRNQPRMNVYLAPDATGVYSMKCYVLRKIEDAAPVMGQTLDVNYRFLDAFAAGMAARLAQKWSPGKWIELKKDAAQAWNEAAIEDREFVDTYIGPDLSVYYPR